MTYPQVKAATIAPEKPKAKRAGWTKQFIYANRLNRLTVVEGTVRAVYSLYQPSPEDLAASDWVLL
jgi:hypothetical protein